MRTRNELDSIEKEQNKNIMDFATLKSQGLIGPMTAPPARAATFPFCFGLSGLHEVTQTSYGDHAAVTGFMLAAVQQARPGAWLWISQHKLSRDLGFVPESALHQMSRTPPPRLNVETRTLADSLWAVEEAVVSGAVSLVVADIEAADFTATRRLTLASSRHGVPVILLMPHTCEGATAATTRWRVRPRPSAPNRYDPDAPGHPRWHAVLERCRLAPNLAGTSFDLEWNEETLSLGAVPALVSQPAAPAEAVLSWKAG